MIIKRAAPDLVFDIVVYLLLGTLLVLVAYPLYFIVIASVSDPALVSTGQVLLWPKGFSLEGYKKVIEYKAIWTGYANSILYTVLFTLLGVSVTMMAGFALSKRDLPGKGLIMAILTFQMFFSGGIVPTYLIVKALHLNNTMAIIVLLGSVSVYRLIITRTYLQSNIPDELYEAALIDGCGHTKYFVAVVLPLSKAIIAVLVVFCAVAQWNSWFNAMIYLKDQSMMPLQMVLRDILVSQQQFSNEFNMVSANEKDMSSIILLAESMKYAIIIVSSVPVLLLYPLAQKYFVKGVMIGAIKG